MNNELELVSDGDGLAVIGDATTVDLFLSSAGVASREFDFAGRLGSLLSQAAGLTQVGSQVAAESGRWVKLTEESAKAMKLGKLMRGSSDSINRAVVVTNKGEITKLLEIVKPGAGTFSNPALLGGAAGIMAQLAMEQAMEEITDYLAVIDEKVDDVLRAQKDAAIAPLLGVGFVIDEAMEIRREVGHISDVTWSKVQATTQTIAQAQGYALLQLDALTEKLEKKSRVGDMAKVAREAETAVRDWLAVLARCFQLQDAVAVLELDRVLMAGPEELERHRRALRHARAKRRSQITARTEQMLERMDAAAGTANAQVLLHPLQSSAVITSSNHVANEIVVFHEGLGVEGARDALEAKRWLSAAGDVRDKVIEAGAGGVDAASRIGRSTLDNARARTDRLAEGVTGRWRRLRGGEPSEPDADTTT
ncbi:rRNA processing protein Krr1/Pno1 [Friedmanniella endophytica]|uniref:rRNA processing protein Krr1/Pno1 n=1 Tax=Microlunatus kandeliicorticis TaxID=1759536 RepID=A0A7W3P576_9ACTN|nr:hypothetical protein [Microlunatus kandeliicorticis]MBA8793590.1 rRNA processing protein Krr1/Pno1 [Microlunatus kandeliicorticis]